jgi:Mn-dependent DtxR family transcriptional regulator
LGSSSSAAPVMPLQASGRAALTVGNHRLAERLLVDVVAWRGSWPTRKAGRMRHGLSKRVERKLVRLLPELWT